MKMNLKNIIFILGVLFLGSSCENFLDVHPKGEVTGKELLKDRKGFENALYGVYATMRNQTLYGRYLSYYTLDRKSTRLNSSHSQQSRMPSSA